MKKVLTFVRTLKALYRALVRRLYAEEIRCYRLTSSWFRGLTAQMPSPEMRTAGSTLPMWLQLEIDLELDAVTAELEVPPALPFSARLMRQLASLAA